MSDEPTTLDGPMNEGKQCKRLAYLIAFGVALVLGTWVLTMPMYDRRLNPLSGVVFFALVFVGGVALAQSRNAIAKQIGLFMVATTVPWIAAVLWFLAVV